MNALQCLRNLISSRRGNVAVMFAATLFPILTLSGFAIDLANYIALRSRLSGALDAAALAIGSSSAPDEELQARFQEFFKANFPTGTMGATATATLNVDGNAITASVNASMPTLLLGLIGINELDVALSNEVSRLSSGMELVMALDNTGSMSGTKLVQLKEAATELVDVLFGDAATSDAVKIGIVPFAQAVNIGPSRLDLVAPAPSTFDWGGTSWWGCVEARAYPNDVRDTSTAVGGFWKPFYWADNSNYNDWKQTTTSGYGRRQTTTTTYDIDNSPPSSRGPNKSCSRELLPMTNVKATILSKINEMWAVGNTHIVLGADWAWKLISPEEPFTEGSAYGTPEWQKAVVIMSDGENTHSNSAYSAYGYLSEGRLGTTRSSGARQELDDRLVEVCVNMKNAGITVYTVLFDLEDELTKELMRTCASSLDKAFVAGQTELKAVFHTIGGKMMKPRLAK